MKNFIDFIVDAAKDSGLAAELGKVVDNSGHKDVSTWLSSKGYDVHEDECKKMVDNKDKFTSSDLGCVY